MPNEFDAALATFRPDPEALKNSRLRRRKSDEELIREGYEEQSKLIEEQAKEQARAEEEMARERERRAKEQARMEEDRAKADIAAANDQNEPIYRREGRPTYTDSAGRILPVDDDATWAAKQQEKRLEEEQKAQAKADAAFRKAEAVRLNQAENKLEDGLNAYKQAGNIASQAVQAKAGEIMSLSQAHKAASDDALPPAQRNQITNTPEYQQWLAGQPPEIKSNPFAISDYLAERIHAARKEKEALENNERTLNIAKTNRELEIAPERRAIEQQRAALPITTAPKLDGVRSASVDVPNPNPTPASQDAARTAAVLRDHITVLREKGDFERAAALEKRLTQPEAWQAEQAAFRAKATPEALVQSIEEQAPQITERHAAIRQQYAGLKQQQQVYVDRLNAAQADNERLLSGTYSDADTVNVTDQATGEVQKWHKTALQNYHQAASSLRQWEQQNRGQIDLLDIEQQQLAIDAANVDRHQRALQFKQREAQREQDAQRSQSLTRLRQIPGMAEFADETERRAAEFKQRQVELERKYPDPKVRQIAAQALQEDFAKSEESMQERMQAKEKGINSLYADYGSTTDIDDWQTSDRSPINLKKLAEDRGITEQEARTILDTGRKLDWRRPLPGDDKGVRKLPSGQLSVDPKLWLDPKDYEKAVNDSDATPEAKKTAISVRRDLAAPDAAAMLLDLQKVPEFAEYLAKKTSGTPVERMEQFQADLKAGGTLAASIQRMQGGTSSLASSALSAVAAVTGSDYFRGKAEEYQQRAQAFETAGAAGARGTNAVGNFTSKVAGAAPSLLGAMVPGGLAVRGAMEVNAFRLAYGAARADQMRQVVAGFKGAAGAYYGTAVADNLLAASHAAMMAAPALNRVALAGAALGSGAQSFGGTYLEAIQAFEKQGLSPTEAHGRALGAALLSGSVTTALTALSGLRGAESLLAQREVVKKTLVARAKEIGIGFADEALEEGIDQLAQGIIAQQTYNPGKKIEDILSESLEAALIGGVLGGGMTALSETADHFANKGALLAEDLAAADAEITNYQDETLDQVENDHRRNRAALAKAIAQGVGLDGIEEVILNSAGWTRKDKDGVTRADGSLTKIKDYQGPNVLDVDSAGKVKLDKTYVSKLAEVMPTVAGLVSSKQTSWHKPGQIEEPAAQTPTTENSEPKTANSPPLSPAPASPAPSAAPSSGEVGTRTPAGTQQTRGTSGQGPASVTARDTEGMTQAAAPAVSGAAAAPPVKQEPTPDSKEAIAARLPKYADPADPRPQRAWEIANHLEMAGMDRADANIVAANAIRFQGIVGKTVNEQVTSKEFNTFLDEQGVTGDRSTREGTEPLKLSQPTASQKTASPSGAKTQDSTSPPLQPSKPAPKGARPEYPALRAKLAAKEMNVIDALREVMRLSGEHDTGQLQDLLTDHLGIKKPSAAAAVETLRAAGELKGDKNDDISIAASKRASDRQSKPSGKSYTASKEFVPAKQGALAENAEWARTKLSMLARTPPARRRWAYRFLTHLENSISQRASLYDAFAVGQFARQHLDGNKIAVVTIDGKTTLAIDLDRMLADFSYLGDPRAAAAATVMEEDIHAAQKALEKKGGRWTHASLAQQWRDLPEAVQKAVWQAYNNVKASNNQSMPSDWQDDQAYHMQSEFLRMLVQGRIDPKSITESVDASPSLIQSIKDLLADLYDTLRSLIKGLPTSQAVTLDQQVTELKAALEQLGKPSTAEELRTKMFLRDPSAVAMQAMKNGTVFDQLATQDALFTPEGLRRVWDLLTPEMRAQVLRLKKTAAPWLSKKRSDNAALTRDLLTFLLDPRAAEALAQANLTSSPAATASTGMVRRALKAMGDYFHNERPDFAQTLGSLDLPTAQVLQQMQSLLVNARAQFEAAAAVQKLPTLVIAEPQADDEDTDGPAARSARAMMDAWMQEAQQKAFFDQAATLADQMLPGVSDAIQRRAIARQMAGQTWDALKARMEAVASGSPSPSLPVSKSRPLALPSPAMRSAQAIEEALADRENLAQQNTSPQAREALARRLMQEEWSAAILATVANAERRYYLNQQELSPAEARQLESLLQVASGELTLGWQADRRQIGQSPESGAPVRQMGLGRENDLRALGIRVSADGTAYAAASAPVYIENGKIVIKQTFLDDLATRLPITRRQFRLSEAEQRAHLRIRGAPQPITAADVAEARAADQQQQDTSRSIARLEQLETLERQTPDTTSEPLIDASADPATGKLSPGERGDLLSFLADEHSLTWPNTEAGGEWDWFLDLLSDYYNPEATARTKKKALRDSSGNVIGFKDVATQQSKLGITNKAKRMAREGDLSTPAAIVEYLILEGVVKPAVPTKDGEPRNLTLGNASGLDEAEMAAEQANYDITGGIGNAVLDAIEARKAARLNRQNSPERAAELQTLRFERDTRSGPVAIPAHELAPLADDGPTFITARSLDGDLIPLEVASYEWQPIDPESSEADDYLEGHPAWRQSLPVSQSPRSGSQSNLERLVITLRGGTYYGQQTLPGDTLLRVHDAGNTGIGIDLGDGKGDFVTDEDVETPATENSEPRTKNAATDLDTAFADLEAALMEEGDTPALFSAPRELRYSELSTGWLGYPQPRGELTKPKIIQYLKDAMNKPVSRKGLARFVMHYDNAQDLLDHTYFHGTSNFISGTVRPSITLSDRQAEQMGGGGYGEKYWAISLTKSKRTAESFSGQARHVSIHPVLLKKAAKVITMPDVQDAADLDDHILDLWKNQVDAVWIGGGEQELAVINPKAIVFASDSDTYQVLGGYKSENFTLEKAEAARAQAQSILDTYDQESHSKILFASLRTTPEQRQAELTGAEVDVQGTRVRTGTPVTFRFLHNKQSATKIWGKPRKDSDFDRGFEPSGRYVSEVSDPDYLLENFPGQYDAGTLTFENPIVIAGGTYGETSSWKRRLSALYGNTRGKRLSQAILADGYDGVITVSDRGNPSEILDLTTFDVSKALYAADKNLVTVHNLSVANLRHVLKMGGIAVPSLAVIRADKSQFDSFGDITLIARPQLIDPQRDRASKVFNADVYSPRYPSVTLKFSEADSKKMAALMKPFYEELASIGKASYTYGIGNLIDQIKERGFSEAGYNSLANFAFLRSTGKLEAPPATGDSADYMRRMDELRYQHKSPEVAYWLEQTSRAAGIQPEELIFDGFTNMGNRRYKPHDLETVVKILKRKLKDGEGFNYGVLSIRATNAKPFRSLKAIQEARDHIIPTAEMDKLKEETTAEFEALSSELETLREHDAGMDSISDDMKAAAEGGVANGQHLREMYGDNFLEAMKLIRPFLDKLRHMPTEYFEGKMQRAVGLSEFTAAVVPDDLPDDLQQELTQRGITTATYPSNDKAARAAAVLDLAEKSQALFAAPRRAYQTMTFEPSFTTPFGQIVSYHWMSKPVGGMEAQRVSDWSQARTNAVTGRDIVHHFKVLKPDGIHTVSLETALGQLSDTQRKRLQGLIRAEQSRRQDQASGQMALFSSQRSLPSTPWPSDFPDVVIHTNIATMRKHPDYPAAKAGDAAAAIQVVKALIKPARVRELAKQFPNAVWVAVHAEEATGRNKIPLAISAYAATITGQTFDATVVQTNRVHHTGADAAARLGRTPQFQGRIEIGRTYIIVDDVTTSGSSLAGLRDYIIKHGGKVGAAMTLATTSNPQTGYGGYLALKPETRNRLARFDKAQLEAILQTYGVAESANALTNSQGLYVASFTRLDTLRDRLIAAGQEGVRGLDDQSALSPADKRLDAEQLTLLAAAERNTSSLSNLEESAIQGYLNLPDVNVPPAKQPAAKQAIRAAEAVTGPAYLPASDGDAAARGRLDALRERAQRTWRGLMNQDVDALKEAFTEKDSFSTLIHDFVSREIPSFDIRGAIIQGPDDFAAFNLAARTPYFESLKIAVLDSALQVVHSQIVHVGGLNEAVVDPKVVAGILATARMLNPKAKLTGWMIAHNHPSGDPSPSEADKRVTRKLITMGEALGLPLMDHVVTNGQKYFSFRESGIIGSADIDSSIDERPKRSSKPKLPILPTPKDKPVSWGYPANPDGPLADWEAVPTGSTITLHPEPSKALPYLQALRTADPDHYHVLYLDTRLALRAVERFPTSLTTAQLFQGIVLGSAREGAFSYTLGFPSATQSEQRSITVEAATGRREGAPGDWIVRIDGQFESLWSSEAEAREWAASIPASTESRVNEDSAHVPNDQQRRLVRQLRERSQSIGLQFADAMTHTPDRYFSFAENGIMEEPALYASPKLRAAADTVARAARASGIVSYDDFRALIAAKLPQALTALDPILPEVWDQSAQPRLALDLPEATPSLPVAGAAVSKSPRSVSQSPRPTQQTLPFQPRASTIERTMSPLPPGADMTSLERAEADEMQREQQDLLEAADTLDDELAAAADEALDAYQDDPELASSQRLPDIQTAVMIDGKPHTSGDDTHYFTTLDYIMRQLPAWQREDRSQALEKADTLLTNDWLKQHHVKEGFLVDGKFLTRQQTLAHVRKLGLTTPLADTEDRDWFDTTDLAELRALPVSESPRSVSESILAAAAKTNTNPTKPQIDAENYQTGKVTVHGLRLSIENPAGSVRKGTDANGKAWEVTMPHHYGRILGTTGADKDHVDFFLGPDPTSPMAFVVNQKKPGNGHFDEHKVMLGFTHPGTAARGYLDSYSPGWRGYQSIVPMTLPQLKHWLEHGKMSEPVAKAPNIPLASNNKSPQTSGMASTPGAAQSNEPSPGGLSEAEVIRSIGRDVSQKLEANKQARVSPSAFKFEFWPSDDPTFEGDGSYSATWKAPNRDEQYLDKFIPLDSIYPTEAGTYYVGEYPTEFATLEEAQAKVIKKAADYLDDNQGSFGTNLDGKAASVEVFARAAPMFDRFAAPGENWGGSKWGSWYFKARDLDGKPLKLSIRDHEASRADLGLPDKTWEVSKWWEPEDVANALSKAYNWLHENAQTRDTESHSKTTKTETEAGAPRSPSGDQTGNPGRLRSPETSPSQRSTSSDGGRGSRAGNRENSSGSGESILPLNFPPQGGPNQNTNTTNDYYNRRQNLADSRGDANRPSRPPKPQSGRLPQGTESRTSSEQSRRPTRPGPAGQVDQGSRGLTELSLNNTTQPFEGLGSGNQGPREAVAVSEDGRGLTSPATLSNPNLAASPRQILDATSRASFNHLDRWFTGALARQAAKVTSSDPVTAAAQAAAAWWNQDTPGVSTLRSLKELAQREIIPETVLPREVMSAMREMQIKQSMGQQKALDVGRALSDKPKFSDLHYPPEFVENPMHREQMFTAMEQGKVDTLPPALQQVARKLREMLVEAGREAVRQGRMNPETFEGLRTNYMPRFTKEEAQASAGDFAKRFKLGVKDILAQRSTAFHITDTKNFDKHKLPRIINHKPGKWRFESAQARDAFYEEFINRETLNPEYARTDKSWMHKGDAKLMRGITLEMLNAPATMTKEQREVVSRVQRQLRYNHDTGAGQFKKESPYEPKDLVKDPVYAVMRYLAQMTHDNATAEFFNVIEQNPDWTSRTDSKGFTQIPDNDRFGSLAGKYVRKDIADQVMELAHTPAQVIQLYDTLLRLWKTGKTVLNPATHARNIIGNLPFAQFAGNNALNPANWPHYLKALRVLRAGGDEFRQLYETGVLGADYASTELRAALENIVPVVQENDTDGPIKHLIALGNRAAQWGKAHSLANVATLGSVGATAGFIAAGPLGALAGAGVAAAANPLYRAALWAYRMEDDLFKAAAFFKARSMGLTLEQSAQHVRDWFPYYDKPTSTTLKFAGRTAMPFLSFFRESARIGAKAIKERPLSLAVTLSIPAIITALSQAALGLDDEDMEDVKSGMRGKGAKLLGMTPLEGVPIFSMLVPWRTSSGQLQQLDLSSTHPMADFLANRVENWNNDPWWQAWSRSALANPMLGALYTAATGRDPFGDRTLWDSSYTPDEKAKAILGHAWKTAMPPLAPGGTNWTMIEQSSRRQANKTLALRSPAQAVARGVAGIDVRTADPDIYALADAFRKRRGLPVTEANVAYPTDAAGRARKSLFEELVQPQPDTRNLVKHLQALNDLGKPVRTVTDVLDILDYRRPDGVINPKELRGPFRASLSTEARRVLDTALREFQRARAATPGAFAKARQQIKPTTRPPITEP